MLVYRIAKSEHIRDLSGAGERLYGGRWNRRGSALVYTSGTRSLATVELLVHVSLPYVPTDLSIATIEIPDDERLDELDPSRLPSNWRSFPAPLELAELGTSWARSNQSLALRVPSAAVEREFNVLINPTHPSMERVAILGVEIYTLDRRLTR